MEWSRVEINRTDVTERGLKESLIITGGLDTNAYSSHQKFMNDAPHLEEVMKIHRNSFRKGVISRYDADMDSHFKAFEEAVSALGAVSMESGLEIPIINTTFVNIVLEKAIVGNEQVFRLIAPEDFGGILETFSLPEGARFDGAIWSGNSLKIQYKF